MRTNKLTRASLATVASVVALGPLAACSTSDPQSSPSSSSSPTEPARAPEGGYADGTYQAVGEYGGGPSYLDVTVTIDDSAITAVTVEPMAENETSRGFQERFAAAVPDEVIGKSLDDADVGKLAGASTCPDGFNAALSQIRTQASEDA